MLGLSFGDVTGLMKAKSLADLAHLPVIRKAMGGLKKDEEQFLITGDKISVFRRIGSNRLTRKPFYEEKILVELKPVEGLIQNGSASR